MLKTDFWLKTYIAYVWSRILGCVKVRTYYVKYSNRMKWRSNVFVNNVFLKRKDFPVGVKMTQLSS